MMMEVIIHDGNDRWR